MSACTEPPGVHVSEIREFEAEAPKSQSFCLKSNELEFPGRLPVVVYNWSDMEIRERTSVHVLSLPRETSCRIEYFDIESMAQSDKKEEFAIGKQETLGRVGTSLKLSTDITHAAFLNPDLYWSHPTLRSGKGSRTKIVAHMECVKQLRQKAKTVKFVHRENWGCHMELSDLLDYEASSFRLFKSVPDELIACMELKRHDDGQVRFSSICHVDFQCHLLF